MGLDAFGHDNIWLVLIKVVGIFAFLVVMTLFMINWERKVVARMQHRPGPNRVGPNGWLQSLADGLKLAFKEDIRPVLADKWVFFLAPVISCIPAFLAFSVIPLAGEVNMFGQQTALQLVDLPVGVLVVLACSSIGVYGIVLSGWASGSPYPLLGALRSAAQVISYEIAMGLSIVAVIMFTGSMSTGDIVGAQASTVLGVVPGWFCFLLFPSFVIYVISMVGETNRAPFDLPEAEGELVGGFHTEYSSLKFALFFLAEYVNMATVSALATTLFLGGWHVPFGIEHIWPGANQGYWPFLWFMGKVLAFIFLFIWLRGTLPRLRYDQFMAFGWKRLIPIALVWIIAVAGIRAVNLRGGFDRTWLYGAIAVLVVLIAVLLLVDARSGGEQAEEEPEEQEPFDAFAGGYPVPPMPGQLAPMSTTGATTTSGEPAEAASGAGKEH